MNRENTDSKPKKLETNYEELEKVGRNPQDNGAILCRVCSYGEVRFFEKELPKYFKKVSIIY
jgi:hypothetical protein